MPWAVAAAGVSGAAGIASSAVGANAQVTAEQNAIAAQQNMLQQGENFATNQLTGAQNTLSPYINAGNQAQGWYQYLTGTGAAPAGVAGTPGANGQPQPSSYNPLTAPLTAPFSAATLPSTPGYQFTLDQGLKSTQNSYAAQGLGASGAADKGAAQYATGLAQNTYNQQFQNYLTQNAQIGNLLYQPASLGAGAAGTLAGLQGSIGAAGLGANVSTGQGIASSLVGQGNAIANAATGSANALSSGVNNALTYSLLGQYLNSNSSNALTSATAANPFASSSVGVDPLYSLLQTQVTA